ncbi:C6 transcription factor [Stagonosporopsis vannaccii]|nr:C6 transcription factor [Stagonosporopsis vannaccii]
MPSARQNSAACWTCKVRRKKCNQGLPTCKDCTLLEIDCHYSDNKPIWMDNGIRQQQMAERLKLEVKRNLSRRSRRNKIQTLSRDLSSSPAEANPLPPAWAPTIVADLNRNQDAPFVSLPTPPSPPSRVASHDHVNAILSEGPHDNNNASECNHSEIESTAAVEPASDFESSLLMSYLDFAFPVLFPFYNPPIIEAGRTWLLTLALKFPAFYHNIIGMAAYFSCAVPVLPSPERDACTELGQVELQAHMQKAVQGVQDSLRRVTRKGIHHCLVDNVRLLGNIVQLVNFEVVFASSANWQMHLDAATDLFDQTLRQFGKGRHGANAFSILLEKLRGDVPSNCSFWSAEQAALRFFTALIVHQDVIASTVRQETPKLLEHYDELLAGPPSLEQSSCLLSLEDFTGCPNWVVRSIADISSLNAWKKAAKRAGNLDIIDLVRRATIIQQELHNGNALLDECSLSPVPRTQTGPWQALESILVKSNILKPPTSAQPAMHRAVSKVWAHAAEIYLITVLSGWQPSNVQLRNHVAQALDHLKTIDNPSWLRSMAWPFCVIGCLATKEQETDFLEVANASGGLAMFGTLRDALAIMQKVWSSRCNYNADVWNIAYCLHVLGHSVLLV